MHVYGISFQLIYICVWPFAHCIYILYRKPIYIIIRTNKLYILCTYTISIHPHKIHVQIIYYIFECAILSFEHPSIIKWVHWPWFKANELFRARTERDVHLKYIFFCRQQIEISKCINCTICGSKYELNTSQRTNYTSKSWNTSGLCKSKQFNYIVSPLLLKDHISLALSYTNQVSNATTQNQMQSSEARTIIEIINVCRNT